MKLLKLCLILSFTVYYSLCENIIIEDLEDSDVYFEFAELFAQSTETYNEIYTTQKFDEISTTQKYNEILTTTESLMIVSVSTTKTTSQISTTTISTIQTTPQISTTTKSALDEGVEKESIFTTENQSEDLKHEERFDVDTFEDYFTAEWEDILRNGSFSNGKNTQIHLKNQFQNQAKPKDIDIPTSWPDWFKKEIDYEFQEIDNENSNTDIIYEDQFEINFERFWDENDSHNLNISNVDTKMEMEPQIEMSTTSFEAISTPSAWFDWFKSEIILINEIQEMEDLGIDSIYKNQFENDYEKFWDNRANDIPSTEQQYTSKTLKPKQKKQFDPINISEDVLQWFRLEGKNMNEEKNTKMDEYRVQIEQNPTAEIKAMIYDLEGMFFNSKDSLVNFCVSFLMISNSSVGKSAELFVVIYEAIALN